MRRPHRFLSPRIAAVTSFGCGAKGDIFSFVEQFEGLDFRGALKVLAEKAGVPIIVDIKAEGKELPSISNNGRCGTLFPGAIESWR